MEIRNWHKRSTQAARRWTDSSIEVHGQPASAPGGEYVQLTIRQCRNCATRLSATMSAAEARTLLAELRHALSRID
jgi:hypothetical protein